MRLKKGIIFSIHASLLLFLTSCAVGTREAVMYHTFQYPSPVSEGISPVGDVLMIYRFLMDRSVDPQYLVITRNQGAKETLVFQRWARNPADMITELVHRDLEAERLFEKTVDHFSGERYRYALEGQVHVMGGVSQGNSAAKAFFDVEVGLVDFGAPFGGQKNIMRKRYKIEAPCKDSTPASMIEALNETVKEFSGRLRRDIRKALEKPERGREASPDLADRA